MLDHSCILVEAAKQPEVKDWFAAALAPIGYKKKITEGDNEEIAGFSDTDKSCDWWVVAVDEVPQRKTHHAFLAKDRASVDAFYHAGIAAGGKCNGPPGLRPHHGPIYYAAFVLDPAGNNIEAVCREPEPDD